jgi:hypothetical protein
LKGFGELLLLAFSNRKGMCTYSLIYSSTCALFVEVLVELTGKRSLTLYCQFEGLLCSYKQVKHVIECYFTGTSLTL